MNRASRNIYVLMVFALGLLPVAGGAFAAGKWVSHVDPSLISEIVLRDGELYMATSGGLLIYQPVDSTVEQFNNTVGLPSNFLTCLTFDSFGDIFVGTEDAGIARLRSVSGGFDITTLNATFHGLASDRITSVAAWGDSVVYGAKGGAGLIVKGFASTRFLVKDGLPSSLVKDVFPDGDFVWIATDGGVARLDRLGFITTFSSGLPAIDAHVFARDDTTIWVGTSAGLARFDAASGTWVADGLAGQPIFSITFANQALWAGTNRRAYENTGSGWTLRANLNPLYIKYVLTGSLSKVRGVQPLADGSVYIGTQGEDNARRGTHLVILDAGVLKNIQFDAPPANRLTRLSFDTDESLWASSLSFGVGKITPSGSWFSYNSASGDTNLTNRSTNLTFLADRQGSKWFATLSVPFAPKSMDELRDGLDTDVSNDVWIHHDIGSGGGDGLGSLRAIRAAEDPEGNRWFLSDDQEEASGWWGINILSADGSQWKQVNPMSTNAGMAAGSVADVAFGDGGLVYVALKNFGVQFWFTLGYETPALFDFNDDTWSTLAQIGDGNISPTATILSLALRSDKVLWIGTTEGVYKWERGNFRHIQANRGFGVGLLGPEARDLLLDRDENLWVATDLGLNRIARDDDNDIASFTTPAAWQTQLSLFFSPDVVSPIADESCDALALHPTQDLLYVATDGGLSVLDLKSLQPRTTNLSDVYLFPNPVFGFKGHNSLKIGNINSPVNIEIFTLEGELVHTQLNVTNSEAVVWDLTTDEGFLASSGVYAVRVSGDSGTVVIMVSILR